MLAIDVCGSKFCHIIQNQFPNNFPSNDKKREKNTKLHIVPGKKKDKILNVRHLGGRSFLNNMKISDFPKNKVPASCWKDCNMQESKKKKKTNKQKKKNKTFTSKERREKFKSRERHFFSFPFLESNLPCFLAKGIFPQLEVYWSVCWLNSCELRSVGWPPTQQYHSFIHWSYLWPTSWTYMYCASELRSLTGRD